METRVLNLQSVLSERQRWCVPVYQRHYAWETGEDKQLARLWEDIQGKAEDSLASRTSYPHYIGAVLVAEPPSQPFGTVHQRLLVDGQQRMTTFQLVLAAVREVGRQVGIFDFDAAIHGCLFNEISAGMAKPEVEKFKLWPSSFDRVLFQAIVTLDSAGIRKQYPDCFYLNGNLKSGQAPKLLAAFWYLMQQVRIFVDETEAADDKRRRIEAVLHGFLRDFRMVIIQLDQTDDAQEIFSSLNGLGKPLSPFDLIRNDVFHRARKAQEDDEALFEGKWKTFEDPFWEVETRQGRFKRARIDFFLAHMLVAETAKEVNLGKLAVTYQAYSRERKFATIADELARIAQYVDTYRTLVNPDRNHVASDISRFLTIWDQTTFFPLVFFISVQAIDDEEKRKVLAQLKAYVIRRDLCGGTSKNYNNVVLQVLVKLRGQPLSALGFAAALSELRGDAGKLPTDTELVEAMPNRKLYTELPTPRLRYVLQAIEERLRTKKDEATVVTTGITIEHVLPQQWSTHWRLPDGSKAPCESAYLAAASHGVSDEVRQQIAAREALIHTIGNLTMVTGSLNPALSNSDFAVKRELLKERLLAMTREIAAEDSWGEASIIKRGTKLAKLACEIWPI
jgi:hypothetical protein